MRDWGDMDNVERLFSEFEHDKQHEGKQQQSEQRYPSLLPPSFTYAWLLLPRHTHHSWNTQ